MLRNNLIGALLVSGFFFLALITIWLASNYFFSVKEAQTMQFRIQTIQGTMSAMQMLVSDSVEYSKKNPDLDPLLLKFKLKTPPAAVPAQPQPAVRPTR